MDGTAPASSPASFLAPPAGMPRRRLGRYDLVERIGQGAMGEVYKARDPGLDRLLAIKTIAHGPGGLHDGLLDRFRREARAVAALNHPNIVTVYDFGEDGGVLYLAMELLDGCNLATALRERRLPTLAERLDAMEQIADAVAYAHREGVVHRDLKPPNMQRLPDGRIKILDFGLAQSHGVQLTTVGSVLGTPQYMAPEQVRGERADTRSDVFSLGAVFYELLSERRPFPATTLHGVLYQVLQREPEPLARVAPHVPVALAAVVERAMAKDAAARLADAGELLAALGAARARLAEETASAVSASASGNGVPSSPSLPPEMEETVAGPAAPPGAGQPGAVKLTVLGEARGAVSVLAAEGGKTLLDLSLGAGIEHFHECGGRARCTTCRVRVVGGCQHLAGRTPEEERVAARLGWSDEVRLACQARLAGTGDVAMERLVTDDEEFGLLRVEARQSQPTRETPVAALACRLEGYGALARRLPPYDQVWVLNRFLLQAGEPVLGTGGVLLGSHDDEVVALFGVAGGTARESCLAAARAALRILARSEALIRHVADHFGADLRVRIGLDFGRAVLGEIGHPSQRRPTALGAVVPTAAALARLAPGGGRDRGAILGSEKVLDLLEGEIQAGPLRPATTVDGREVEAFELVDLATPDAVLLAQSAFRRLGEHKEAVSRLFYELLFEIDPTIPPLFAGVDLAAQGSMLMSMLTAVFQGLDDLEALRPQVEALARRHVAYGVELRHYDSVGQAFLETARRLLGDAFTTDVRLAWTRVFNQLVTVMIGALDSDPAASAA